MFDLANPPGRKTADEPWRNDANRTWSILPGKEYAIWPTWPNGVGRCRVLDLCESRRVDWISPIQPEGDIDAD